MNKTVIKAEVVAHSLNQQGDELVSLSITFPRIILAEVNTHRMLSKNTSSSRAIPFKKMVEAVQNDPFIPIAWQKHHSGMQGAEYFTGEYANKLKGYSPYATNELKRNWLLARDNAVKQATELNELGLTKQLCNRLLEPFMWTTMLITGSKEGWDNFFRLRCPQYTMGTSDGFYKSRKDLLKAYPANKSVLDVDLYWLSLNKGQAEIHIMDLAEKIYDAVNESTPEQLSAGMWHIPYMSKIDSSKLKSTRGKDVTKEMVKISTAMAARESYTVVGNEKDIDYQKQLELHDRLIEQDPPHSSPFEHCARAMSSYEYETFIKGVGDAYEGEDGIEFPDSSAHGWCTNIKGFIPYRYMVDNNLTM